MYWFNLVTKSRSDLCLCIGHSVSVSLITSVLSVLGVVCLCHGFKGEVRLSDRSFSSGITVGHRSHTDLSSGFQVWLRCPEAAFDNLGPKKCAIHCMALLSEVVGIWISQRASSISHTYRWERGSLIESFHTSIFNWMGGLCAWFADARGLKKVSWLLRFDSWSLWIFTRNLD